MKILRPLEISGEQSVRRASPAFYRDQLGVLREAPPNVARPNYNEAGDFLGLLLEPSPYRSVISDSDDFTNHNVWTIGSGITVGEAVTGPDGVAESALEVSGSGIVSVYDDQVPETTWTLAQSSVTKILQMEMLPQDPATPPEIVLVGAWRRVYSTLASTANLSWPSGHAANDIAVAMVRGPNVSITDGDWTEIGSESGNNTRFYWARATSNSEPPVTVNFPSNGGHCRMFIVRGCLEAGTPIGNFARDDDATDSVEKTAPGITASDGALVVVAAAFFRRATNLFTTNWRNASLYDITVHIDGEGQTYHKNSGGWILTSGKYYVRGKTDSGPVRPSIFVKHTGGDATIRLRNALDSDFVEFDLSTLEADSEGTLEAYDEDWYRITAAAEGPYGFGLELNGGSFEIFRANLVATHDYYQPLLDDRPMTGDATIESPGLLLLYSNIPEPDTSYPPEADAVLHGDDGPPYAENKLVIYKHALYRSKVSDNNTLPDEGAVADEPTWVRLATSNAWKMYDMYRTGAGNSRYYPGVDQATIAEGGLIDQIVYAPILVKGYALLGMSAGHLRVRAYLGTEVVYDTEYNLVDLANNAYWYEFFTRLPERRATLVAFDLPPVAGLTLRFTLTGEGQISLGKIIVGNEEDLGCTKWGVSTDYFNGTRQNRDDFLNLNLVPRRVIKTRNYEVSYDTHDAERVERVMESLMTGPAVFVGSENYATTIAYAIVRSCRTVLPGKKKSILSLSAETI